MGTTNQYYLHGILLPTGVWISQLNDLTPAHNAQEIVEYAGSAVFPSFRGGHGAKPSITFTTNQLSAVLTACGMTGAAYASQNVDLFYRRASNLGTRAAIDSASHLRIRAVRSLFFWDQISASQGDNATIRCRIIPTFDGTNPPLVAVGGQTIVSQPVASPTYTLGPVRLNGTLFDALSSWSLDLGIDVNEKASSGDPWTSFAGISRGNPTLTVSPEDLGNWATITHTGLPITALVAYLRKKSTDLITNVADGTGQHISFTAVDNPCGMATIDGTGGGIGSPANMSIRCGLRISNAATENPLAVSLAATI